MGGIKVVEIGLWVAGPSCGGILADWGADVVKIEPLAGDPFRTIEWQYPDNLNPPFELDNRGKRSLAIDLTDDRGLGIVHELLATADVFITNYRPGGLERVGLDYRSLAHRYPTLIYAQITGYGLGGDERDRAAYDMGAFYSRAGIGAAITPDGQDLPYPRSGMGDHMTGLAAAAGVSAALFDRARTGKGQRIATSLLRAGAYMYGWDHNVSARLDMDAEPVTRSRPPNPLLNGYRCGDGEWIWLLGLESDRHWPNVLAALDKPGWQHDPRFDTIEGRMERSAELVAAIDEVLATRTREEWAPILDRHGVWWAKVQSTLEMRSDPQAHAAGCYVKAPTWEGAVVDMVATPVDFDATPWAVSAPAPELGHHTELVLTELGKDWDEIEELKTAKVIP
jgi:crotonobetainyl-CoA:carnitine CoA-transferase CaiB-like acyl-CoA transferase